MRCILDLGSYAEKYLSPKLTIVYDQDFENVVVKVQNVDKVKRTKPEKLFIQDYLQDETYAGDGKIPEPIEEFNCGSSSAITQSPSSQTSQINKAVTIKVHGWFCSPSNVIERLFDKAKFIYSDFRKSITPFHSSITKTLTIGRLPRQAHLQSFLLYRGFILTDKVIAWSLWYDRLCFVLFKFMLLDCATFFDEMIWFYYACKMCASAE